jgi:hypothetical protein
MTNIGLRITLPLKNIYASDTSTGKPALRFLRTFPVFSKEKRLIKILAALNCRKEGDFFHALALPLCVVGPDLYTRDPTFDISLLSLASLDKYHAKEIFIRNEPTENFGQKNRHLAFLFRDVDPKIKISQVLPPRYWQPKERVLQGVPYGFPYATWSASVLLTVASASQRPRRINLFLTMEFNRKIREHEDSKNHDSIASGSVGKRFCARPWCLLTGDSPDMSLLHKEYRMYCRLQDIEVTIGRRSSSDNGRVVENFFEVLGEVMCAVDIKAHSDSSLASTVIGV